MRHLSNSSKLSFPSLSRSQRWKTRSICCEVMWIAALLILYINDKFDFEMWHFSHLIWHNSILKCDIFSYSVWRNLILKYFPEFCLCHHPITILIKQFEGSPDLKNLVMNMKSRKTHVITKCEKTHFITKCFIFLKANFKNNPSGGPIGIRMSLLWLAGKAMRKNIVQKIPFHLHAGGCPVQRSQICPQDQSPQEKDDTLML